MRGSKDEMCIHIFYITLLVTQVKRTLQREKADTSQPVDRILGRMSWQVDMEHLLHQV